MNFYVIVVFFLLHKYKNVCNKSSKLLRYITIERSISEGFSYSLPNGVKCALKYHPLVTANYIPPLSHG
jgi:hypothetical protein